MGKDNIKIISGTRDELGSSITFGEEKYLIQTEGGGQGNRHVTTHVYLKGKVISKITTNQDDIINQKDFEERMRRQHQSVIDMLRIQKEPEKKEETKAIQTQQEITPADYLKTVKTLLMRKNQKGALELLKEAVEQHPEDPFILSYFGCLEAIVEKKYRIGIDACKKAMVLLKRDVPFGEEFLYPMFYLNLGRAYLTAGKRKDAINAFKKGLETDRENSDLIMELRRLGVRKRPTVPFLHRANPINKYIGIILHRIKK